MRIDVLTLFPGIVRGPLAESILGRAQARGLVDIRVHDLRDWAPGRHRVTDEPPFGGGGDDLKPEPSRRPSEDLRGAEAGHSARPAGPRLTQEVARELAGDPSGAGLGRYEGVDERVRERLVDEELSIGDYVLTGGELPALVVTEAVTRLLPGVLGHEAAPTQDSFARGLLEHPQYTRPEVFREWTVPEILLSGDHGKIARWRQVMSLARTWQRRPDLLETADLSPQEQKWVDGLRQGRPPSDFID